MPPRPLYCIDRAGTKIAEDGYFVTYDQGTSKVTIAAVSVDAHNISEDAIYETIGRPREQRSRINKKMFSPEYIFEHNLMSTLIIPAIIVDFDVEKDTYLINDFSVSLAPVSRVKQITHRQVETYLRSRNWSPFKDDIDLIGKVLTHNQIPSFNTPTKDMSLAGRFVMNMLKIYNYACTEACVRENIPYIGKFVPGIQNVDPLGIFNCPIRNSEAAINNINLSHFLRHGEPYYTYDEIEILVEHAKAPVS